MADIREEIRQLLRDELRIKVNPTFNHGFIESLEITLFLGKEPIAYHVDYMGWPENKENGI